VRPPLTPPQIVTWGGHFTVIYYDLRSFTASIPLAFAALRPRARTRIQRARARTRRRRGRCARGRCLTATAAPSETACQMLAYARQNTAGPRLLDRDPLRATTGLDQNLHGLTPYGWPSREPPFSITHRAPLREAQTPQAVRHPQREHPVQEPASIVISTWTPIPPVFTGRKPPGHGELAQHLQLEADSR